MAVALRPQSEHLYAPVLSEMMIEGKRPSDATGVEHGERDRIAQSPILVSVSSKNLSRLLLFSGEYSDDRQTAGQQPLTGNRPSELSQEECVRFRFDVIGDETGPGFGCDFTRHHHGLRVVGIIRVEQRENGARIPEDRTSHRSRMPCLSRAPGVLPPPRPAPTRRNIGWSCENGGMSAVG